MRGTVSTTAAEGTRRFVSPSELASIGCWRAYRWKRDGIQPIQKFEALSFGTAWDAFMGEWWKPVGVPGDGLVDTRSSDERLTHSLAAGQAAIDAEARRVDGVLVDRGLPRPFDWEDTQQRHRTRLLGMALHYASTVGNDTSVVCRASQFKVEVPLPSASGTRRSGKFWMRGYIDRVMENHQTGNLFIVDDKSAGRVNTEYTQSFKYDLQLPLYAWAMRSLDYYIEKVCVEAAAKLLPVFPEVRKTLVTVLGPDGEPLTEPVPCPACNGAGDPFDSGEACGKCQGEGVARFASGPRKGEVKTAAVKRRALRSMLSEGGDLNYTTTLPVFEASLDLNGLDRSDYERELEYLAHQDEHDNPFFNVFPLIVDHTMMDEAEQIIRAAAPLLDKIPDLPLRDRFRCSRCVFRVPCVERNADARADLLHEGFTTREQRDAMKAEQEARDEANAALAFDDPSDAPVSSLDELDAAFAAADTTGADALDGIF